MSLVGSVPHPYSLLAGGTFLFLTVVVVVVVIVIIVMCSRQE
jgi:uncharacterized membrane protein